MLDPHAATLPTTPPGAPRADTGPLGRRFARFVLLDRLGHGAMGVVYSAYDPELDRRVALKLLADPLSPTVDLLTEARALARLNHPNVVQVHDVGSTDGKHWLAMAYLDGPTLTEWLADGPAQGAVIACHVALGEGLGAAHAAGVVHRDFKPDNVVFGADGRPRIIDFGLASWHGEGEAGGVWGTPGYIAPEVLQGQPASPAADQFAFCATLYRALFGQAPFAGRGLLAVARSMAEGRLEPPPPGHGVPPWIVAAIRRGLAADPADRWPSMRSLVAELRRCPASDAGLFAAERARLTRRIFAAMVLLIVLAALIVGDRRPDPDEALLWGLAWPALLGVLLWQSRSWIRESPLNRHLALLLAIAAGNGLVFRLLARLGGLPLDDVMVFELAACAALSGLSVPVMGRWMGAVAAVELAGALLAAARPTLAPAVFMVTMAALVGLGWYFMVRPARAADRAPAGVSRSAARRAGWR